MRYLAIAFGFLTILPVRLKRDPAPGDLSRAAPFFPFVGLVLGACLAGAAWILIKIFGAGTLPVPTLLTALWAVLTGGLHLDGTADCGDGLFAPVPRERRLEIMKDPRLGGFGSMTLALHLLVKFAFIHSLLALPFRFAVPGLLLAPSVARWLLIPASRMKPARPEGMGAEFGRGIPVMSPAVGAVIPLLLLAYTGPRGILAMIAAIIVLLLILLVSKKRLGGVTGDVFGLIVEAGESAVLFVYAIGFTA